jgi:Tfp pilus assembly protein PilF
MRLYCLRAAIAIGVLAVLPSIAAAQVGRVSGIVRDDSGQPIKGATVSAENPNLGPSTFTATTDDKGRFTIIGLRAGTWRFIALAPGHAGDAGEMPVRFGSPNPAIAFTLRRNGPTASAPLGSITAKELQAQLSAADALFNQQRWDEAIAAYAAIAAKTPALSVINLQIAAAHRSKKDYTAALAAYQTLLAIDANNEKAQVGIAATNLEKGDAAAAEATLMRAAESESAGREIFYNLGEVKLARGDENQAVVWYRRAADADASWGKPRYKLGLLAMKAGDNDSALKLMNEVLAVDPVSPEAALASTALAQLKK